MWNRTRDTDKERSSDEHVRRMRARTPPEERPAAYWIFFDAVVGFFVLAALLLAYL